MALVGSSLQTMKEAEELCQSRQDRANLGSMEPVFNPYFDAISAHLKLRHKHLLPGFQIRRNAIANKIALWLQKHQEVLAPLAELFAKNRLNLMRGDWTFRKFALGKIRPHLNGVHGAITSDFNTKRAEAFEKMKGWIERNPYLLADFHEWQVSELANLLARAPLILYTRIDLLLNDDPLLEEFKGVRGDEAQLIPWLNKQDQVVRFLQRLLSKETLELMEADEIFKAFALDKIDAYLKGIGPDRILEANFQKNVQPFFETYPEMLELLATLNKQDVLLLLGEVSPFRGIFYQTIETFLRTDHPHLIEEWETFRTDSLANLLPWFQVHPEALDPVTSLKFEGVRLTVVPRAVASLSFANLTDLSFDDNELSFFPEIFFRSCPNIEHFSMINNQVEQIPEVTDHWKKIVTLRLDFNQLREFPTRLGFGCKQLKVIQATHNQISSFPKGWIKGMKNLRVQDHLAIYLDFNCLGNCAVELRELRSKKIPVTTRGFEMPTSLF